MRNGVVCQIFANFRMQTPKTPYPGSTNMDSDKNIDFRYTFLSAFNVPKESACRRPQSPIRFVIGYLRYFRCRTAGLSISPPVPSMFDFHKTIVIPLPGEIFTRNRLFRQLLLLVSNASRFSRIAKVSRPYKVLASNYILIVQRWERLGHG